MYTWRRERERGEKRRKEEKIRCMQIKGTAVDGCSRCEMRRESGKKREWRKWGEERVGREGRREKLPMAWSVDAHGSKVLLNLPLYKSLSLPSFLSSFQPFLHLISYPHSDSNSNSQFQPLTWSAVCSREESSKLNPSNGRYRSSKSWM